MQHSSTSETLFLRRFQLLNYYGSFNLGYVAFGYFGTLDILGLDILGWSRSPFMVQSSFTMQAF